MTYNVVKNYEIQPSLNLLFIDQLSYPAAQCKEMLMFRCSVYKIEIILKDKKLYSFCSLFQHM